MRKLGEIIQKVLGTVTRLEDGSKRESEAAIWSEEFNGDRPGSVTLIGGPQGIGKTAFCTSYVRHVVVEQKKPALYCTLEMPAETIVHRLLCAEAGIPLYKTRLRGVSEEEWSAIQSAAERMAVWPLTISEDISLMNIQRLIQEISPAPQVIVIDPLTFTAEFVEASDPERITLVGKIVREMAEKSSLVVLLTAKIMGNSLGEYKGLIITELGDLRPLVQYLDQVAFLTRESYHHPNVDRPERAHLHVIWNRAGASRSIELKFQMESANFADLLSV